MARCGGRSAEGQGEKSKKVSLPYLRSGSFCVIVRYMDREISYRGEVATPQRIEFIRRLIAENPEDSRRSLSKKLCVAWDWVQPNGHLRDMVCRGFMLQLHRAGAIELPERKVTPNNPFVNRKRPPKVEVDETPVEGSLSQLRPILLRQVRRTAEEGLFGGLIEHHHYLGYTQPVGECLKYVAFAAERAVGCLAVSSAPRHIGCRDRFIGWSKEQRLRNLHLIGYNTRFLILPWVRVKFLASHLLSRLAGVVAEEWQRVYGHRIYLMTTFIDTERFSGTCYRAANWKYLGLTTGRGKDDRSNKANRSIKAVWGYPLVEDFRTRLCGERR